jgi:hypothetical protein
LCFGCFVFRSFAKLAKRLNFHQMALPLLMFQITLKRLVFFPYQF